MKRKTKSYGGTRPCSTQPPIMVVGGFTLDPAQKNLPVGAVVPWGTLASVNEATRLAKLIKSARVVAIGTDAQKVTLEADEFSKPLFTVGDTVQSDLSATLANSPSITAVATTEAGMEISLSKAITGLAVGSALFEVVADDTNVKLVAEPNSITIGSYESAEVQEELADTQIDVTRDSGCGEIYARRVPPVPAKYLEGNLLKGTKVAYTQSL